MNDRNNQKSPRAKREDLASAKPALAAQWDSRKNAPITPSDVSVGSGRSFWWLCDQGHSWKASVGNRAGLERGCPYCAGKKVLQGYNDLFTTRPDLSSEWDSLKNGSLNPSTLTKGSNVSVWWLCPVGHSFESSPNSRQKSGCPYCANKKVLPGFNDLATKRPELVEIWDRKRNECGPEEFFPQSRELAWWTCRMGHSWQRSPAKQKNAECPACAGHLLSLGRNDFKSLFPSEFSEIVSDISGSPVGDDIRAHSDKHVIWECGEGHRYQARISDRARGTNCPYCGNKKVLVGFNDFAFTHPALAKTLDEALAGFSAHEVTSGSNKLGVWVCSLGHSWKSRVYSRIKHGCPVCTGRKIVAGVNDLETLRPNLAASWDYEKNISSPSSVSPHSSRRFHWKCDQGHSSQSAPGSRKSGGCPVCSNKVLSVGHNDLKSTNPDLASQWHPERNGNVTPEMVMEGGAKSYWWLCPLGHEWFASLTNRRKTNCPVCANRQVLRGFNDLSSLFPKVARQWHPTKNQGIGPESVIPRSQKKYWWVCQEGHEWEAVVASRLRHGCPKCAKFGFDPESPAELYFLHSTDLMSFKVGITGAERTYKRLNHFRKFGWESVARWTLPGSLARSVETRFFNWLRNEQQVPAFLGKDQMPETGGWTETFEAAAIPERVVLSVLSKMVADSELP